MHKPETISCSILIINHTPEVLRAMTHLLTSAGYAVLQAATGAEGLCLARAHQPEIILLDARLPDMDSHVLCGQIKHDALLSQSFLVLLSDMDTPLDNQSIDCGQVADSYLTLPVTDRELLARVADFLRLKHAEDAVRESEIRFRAIFDSSIDAIGISHNGIHTYANPAFLALFGYTNSAELIGTPILPLFSPAERPIILDNIARRSRGEMLPGCYESSGVRKDGSTFDMELHISTYTLQEKHFTLAVIRDITEQKRTEHALSFLLQCGWPSSGEDFFPSLARFLAETLGMDYVCIDRLTGDRLTAHTVAVFHNGHFEENVTYSLQDTPCGDVVGKTICIFPREVSRLFPHDAVLQEMRADSYIGTTLWSADGRPIGLIAIIGRQPLVNPAFAEKILLLAAVRAAGELERLQTEEALRESETTSSTIVQSSPVGITMATVSDGKFVAVNDLFLHDTGYTRDEVLGHTALELDLFVDYADRERLLSQLRAGQRVYCEECCFRIKNGRILTCLISMTTVTVNGRPCILSTIIDITERRQAEEALRESEARFRGIFTGTAVGTAVVAPDGRFLQVNPAFCHFLGYSADELLLKTVLEITAPEDRTVSGQAMQRILANNETVQALEKCYLTHTGEHVWGEVSIAPVCDAHGVPEYLIAQITDITVRKQAEDALRHNEARLTEAQRIGRVGSYAFNIVENTWTSSPVLDHIFGITDAYDRTAEGWLNLVHPEDRVRMADYLQTTILTAHQPFDRDYRIVRPADGAVHWVYGRGEVQCTAEGAPLSLTGMIQDITERKLVEEQLRVNEARFRTLVETIPQKIFTKDRHFRWISINANMARDLGVNPEDVVGKDDYDFFPPALADKYRADDQRVMETGETLDFEERYLQHGKEIWVNTVKTPVRDELGEIIGIFGIFWDITAHKQAEEALQHEQEFTRALLDNITDGVVACDANGRLVLFNRTAREWHGLDALSLPADEWGRYYDIFGPDGVTPLPTDAIPLVRAFRGETVHDAGMTIVATGQPPRHILAGGAPFFDAQHHLLGAVVAMRDITERKRAEQELEETRAILQAALDNSQAGIAIAEAPEGKLRYVNQAGLFMRGKPAEEVVQNIDLQHYVDSWQLLDLAGHPLQREDVPLARAILYGEMCTREFIIRRAANDDVVVWANAAPIHDASGKITAGIVVFLDITDQKKAEAERAALQTQLAQALKMESVGRLAGGVAHDFNNMLGVILGNAEMMMAQLAPTDPLAADLAEIKKAAQRSADLTRQLLAFARKQTVAPRVLDLNEIISGMLKMLQRLIGENIDLTWRPGAELWPVNIDPAQVDQILVNLCINARDAISGVGKLTITTANVQCDEAYCSGHAGVLPGEYLLLTVSDTGCGMTEETRSHLFEPFFTTKGVGEGTGLGLAMVYGVVKQNNGFIYVYSEPGQGATFRIYLPRCARPDAPSPEVLPVLPCPPGHETVLVVEDEPAILSLGQRVLALQGYQVLTASTPSEALQLADTHAGEIHLLLTDVIMPEMNGRDLAQRLRTRYPHLKRIFMSGYTADIIAHHGVLEDGVHFLQKPFTIAELARSVRAALDE